MSDTNERAAFEAWARKKAMNLQRDSDLPGTYAHDVVDAAWAAWEDRAAQEVRQEPVAWAQLGMRNGHTYVRMHYEGPLYPPPPDVQRNLNLVPLYAAPQPPQPVALTEEQIRSIAHACGSVRMMTGVVEFARAVERAHGIKGE